LLCTKDLRSESLMSDSSNNMPLPLAFAIEQGIATVLRLDPHTTRALSAINGKVIRVEVSAPSVAFHLIVVDGKVDVVGSFDDKPDTTISGSATDLLSLRTKNDALYTGAVKLAGDLDTGELLRNIIGNIDIDLEEVIAPITGDALARQLGRIGNSFSAWFTDTSNSMKRNTSEYLQEEAQFLAPNSEINRFGAEVDNVREQTDRLIARFDVIEKNSSLK